MKKTIFIIIGSASQNSANEKLIEAFIRMTEEQFTCTVFNDLRSLPHFEPELSNNAPPESITQLRNQIASADAVVICTPEYVFSIPSGLKNAIEWCVSTSVFSDKVVGLITASADGEMGHKELQLIMKTLTARFSDDTTLLIRGIKGKINRQGEITDTHTVDALTKFISALQAMLIHAL